MLLKNTTTIAFSPPTIEFIDLRIRGGTITERIRGLRPLRGEEVVDLKGKLLMPGFVNAHTHLYSSLARGMPGPKNSPRNFLEILQKIWWKLDRALDEESIYYSALVGAIEGALCGTTTLIDHHASPNAIQGSLDIVKEAMQEVGLRGVLCYEVTDRGGVKERNEGLKENERFIRKNTKDSLFRGIVGAHALFTLSNESLHLCGELVKKTKTGVHIHVAEDRCDVVDVEENYRCGVIERLTQHGLIQSKSILAHCIHLQPMDFSRLRKANCWLIHNPRSNMNNNVGHAPIHLFGERAALGTDGFPADMFEELRMGYFRMQEGDKGLEVSGSRFEKKPFTDLLASGQRMISEIFSQQFGTLAKGSVADLIVLDYKPPTPMTKDNLQWHVLFGMRSSMVESVMVGGRWVVKEREVVGVDVPKVFEKAAKVAKGLWERMG